MVFKAQINIKEIYYEKGLSLLLIAMLVMSMAACGNDTKDNPDNKGVSDKVVSATKEPSKAAPTPTPESTSEPSEGLDSVDSDVSMYDTIAAMAGDWDALFEYVDSLSEDQLAELAELLMVPDGMSVKDYFEMARELESFGGYEGSAEVSGVVNVGNVRTNDWLADRERILAMTDEEWRAYSDEFEVGTYNRDDFVSTMDDFWPEYKDWFSFEDGGLSSAGDAEAWDEKVVEVDYANDTVTFEWISYTDNWTVRGPMTQELLNYIDYYEGIHYTKSDVVTIGYTLRSNPDEYFTERDFYWYEEEGFPVIFWNYNETTGEYRYSYLDGGPGFHSAIKID